MTMSSSISTYSSITYYLTLTKTYDFSPYFTCNFANCAITYTLTNSDGTAINSALFTFSGTTLTISSSNTGYHN